MIIIIALDAESFVFRYRIVYAPQQTASDPPDWSSNGGVDEILNLIRAS